MADIIRLFCALDGETQLAILLPVAMGIAGGFVWLLRKVPRIGLKDRPGLTSNIVAVLVGAALGYAGTQSLAGVVIGVMTGLSATGVHQIPTQVRKRLSDLADAEQKRLPFD